MSETNLSENIRDAVRQEFSKSPSKEDRESIVTSVITIVEAMDQEGTRRLRVLHDDMLTPWAILGMLSVAIHVAEDNMYQPSDDDEGEG